MPFCFILLDYLDKVNTKMLITQHNGVHFYRNTQIYFILIVWFFLSNTGFISAPLIEIVTDLIPT